MGHYKHILILIIFIASQGWSELNEKHREIAKLKEQLYYEIICHQGDNTGFVLRDNLGNEKHILKGKKVVYLDSFRGRIYYRFRTTLKTANWANAVYNITTDEDKEVQKCPWEKVYEYASKLFKLKTPRTEPYADAIIFETHSKNDYKILDGFIYFVPTVVKISRDKEIEYKPTVVENGITYVLLDGFKRFTVSSGKVTCGASVDVKSTVFRLDLNTLSCIPLFDGAGLVETEDALYFIRKKDYLYTPGTDAQIIKYNLVTGEEKSLNLPGIFPNDLVISKKNDMLFIGTGIMTKHPEMVYVYSLKANTIINSLPGRLDNSGSSSISPDENYIFIVEPPSDALVKYKLPELKVEWRTCGKGYTPYICFVKIKE